MARLQATLPEPLYAQMQKIGERLGLSVSEVGAEACSLFVKSAMEVERGRRVAFVGGDESTKIMHEFSSPALMSLELLSAEREHIVLPEADFDRMQEVLDAPPEPNEALRALSKGNKRTSG